MVGEAVQALEELQERRPEFVEEIVPTLFRAVWLENKRLDGEGGHFAACLPAYHFPENFAKILILQIFLRCEFVENSAEDTLVDTEINTNQKTFCFVLTEMNRIELK